MSYIPDCRTDENYNQRYLNDKDGEFLRGYDWCTETAVDNFFDNLDIYFGDDSHIMHLLNEKIPKGAREDYEMEFTFGEREAEVRKTKTVADVLRYKMLDYIEKQRDELITSMIDNMDEKEYNDIRAKANGEQE